LADDPATLIRRQPQQIDTVADFVQALPGFRCQAHPEHRRQIHIAEAGHAVHD
jgi:hypothetical protein